MEEKAESGRPREKFKFSPLDLNALSGQTVRMRWLAVQELIYSLLLTRLQLVRLEETIIFGLIERSQFKQNPSAYAKDGIKVLGAGGASQFHGSIFSYYLTENEKVHAAMRRYTSPDEHPFTP
eukprot:1392118-Amorphochlora_amoeboformis.AAC.1